MRTSAPPSPPATSSAAQSARPRVVGRPKSVSRSCRSTATSTSRAASGRSVRRSASTPAARRTTGSCAGTSSTSATEESSWCSVSKAEIVVEAERILDAAHEAGVPLRLMGGLAVYAHSEEIPEPLRRSYDDIDLATTKKAGRRTSELLVGLGYEPAKEFNALQGDKRLLFHDPANERKLDVFVESFVMCHTIPITG